jgi:hypothetical protein
MGSITPEDARQYLERWKLVEEQEITELRSTPIEIKARQGDAAAEAARNFGIVPRIDQAVEFARRSRVLLLKHTQSDIAIDLILGGLPFEQEAVGRARTHRLGDITVRLPRVEDLIIMKVIAHRDKDMQDVEGLLDAHPEVNFDEIRQHVSEFAAATSMSDLNEDFERLLQRRKAKQPVARSRPK